MATTYTYDASGNTLSITSPIQQRLLAWNAENRLIGLTVTDASGARHIDYEYNDAGLRVSQTVDGQEIRFLVDELLGFGEVLEEYDEAGNTLADYTYGIDLVAQERSGQTSYFQPTDRIARGSSPTPMRRPPTATSLKPTAAWRSNPATRRIRTSIAASNSTRPWAPTICAPATFHPRADDS